MRCGGASAGCSRSSGCWCWRRLGRVVAAPIPAMLSTASGDRLVQLDRDDLRVLPGALAAASRDDGRGGLGGRPQRPPAAGRRARAARGPRPAAARRNDAPRRGGQRVRRGRRRLAVAAPRDRDRGRRSRGRRRREPAARRLVRPRSPARSQARTPIPIALDGFGVDAIGNRIVVSSSGPDATVWTVIGAAGRVEREIRLPAAAGAAPAFFRGRSSLAVVVPERGPLIVVDLASGRVRQLHRPDLPPPRRGAAGAQPAQAAWIDADTFVLVGIAGDRQRRRPHGRLGDARAHRLAARHERRRHAGLERRRRRPRVRLRALPPGAAGAQAGRRVRRRARGRRPPRARAVAGPVAAARGRLRRRRPRLRHGRDRGQARRRPRPRERPAGRRRGSSRPGRTWSGSARACARRCGCSRRPRRPRRRPCLRSGWRRPARRRRGRSPRGSR